MDDQKATETSCGDAVTKHNYSEFIKRLEMIREKVKVVNEKIRGLQTNKESSKLQYHHCLKNKGHINYLQQLDSKTSEQLQAEDSLRQEVKHMEEKLNKEAVNIKLLQKQLVNQMKENIIDLQKLQSQVLDEELVKWKYEQQLSGIGVHMYSNLDVIQNLCEHLAELIWSTWQQVNQVARINSGIIPEMRQSHFAVVLDVMKKQVTSLLSTLVTSTFVVENHSQVIRVKVRFTASVRLLVARPLNLHMTAPQVTVMLISEEQALLLLQSNFASWSSKPPVECGDILNNSECMKYKRNTGKFCADFWAMLTNIKRVKKKITGRRSIDNVTDEKLVLLFHSEFNVGREEFVFKVWALSLPVVVIVHGSQEAPGWATIIWDNAFRPPGQIPFEVPDKVPLGQLVHTLRIKFRSEIGGDLSEDNLRFLADKLFSSCLPLDSMEMGKSVMISWRQSCKSYLPGTHFTFWEWFYMALKITRNYLRELWCDGLIIGFIHKKQAEKMLSKSPPGTFLVRFSGSTPGGITIDWVREGNEVFSLQPFIDNDLKELPLLSRILKLTQLQFLYPNVPKDDVFTNYYTKRRNRIQQQPLPVTTLPSDLSAPSPSYVAHTGNRIQQQPLPVTTLPSDLSAPLPSYVASPPSPLLLWYAPSPSYAPFLSSASSLSYAPLPSSVPLPSYAPLPSSAFSPSYAPGSYMNMPSMNSSAATPAQADRRLMDNELMALMRDFKPEGFGNFNFYTGNDAMK